ncbi:MAG: CCA tRNA nucleotidyltransferase [Acidobacteriota bacterium]|nr:CCA tRNA nucleotidyltransferase [Acidobacteriota bacterium]
MADYIYLLENRLSAAQRAALQTLREVARSKGLTIFLVGGAVRDLINGSPVRDLDVVVQGNAAKLKKDIEKAGGKLAGDADTPHSFFVQFPGGVRVEFGSTLAVTFPKPGKPVYKLAGLQDDLRRRDFTANAMALSLNEGTSYGLLIDPLNGVADIENRELRLVSNYGFIEDPVRMIRAARFMARLGWNLEEKTQTRYETGKAEEYIAAMSDFQRGYETEEIFHEEDPLRVLRRLESEGWIKSLFPALSSAKVNLTELEKLRDVQTQLQLQGISPEMATANFPLLTAKLSSRELAELKKMFPRQVFVHDIEALEQETKAFAAELAHKSNTLPSQAWKLIYSAKPEAVLWTAYTTRSAALQQKFKSFAEEWPQARLRIPHALMQEMRIVPGVPRYEELLDLLFFELMDNRLGTVEEMKAFLEPFSPPAPPPTVNLRRARAAKKETKAAKPRKKAEEAPTTPVEVAAAAESEQPVEVAEVVAAPAKPARAAKAVKAGPPAAEAVKKVSSKPAKVAAEKPAPAKKAAAPKPVAKPGKAVEKKAPAKAAPKRVEKPAPKKAAPKKAVTKPAVTKAAPAKVSRPTAQTARKAAPTRSKPAPKVAARSEARKPAVKIPAKQAPAKKTVAAKKATPAKGIAKKQTVTRKPAKPASKKKR